MRLGIVSDGQQPGGRAGSGQVSGEMRLRFKGGVLRVQLSGSAWGHGGIASQPLSRWAFKFFQANYLADESAPK